MNKFNLLLKNPMLNSYDHLLLDDNYISDILGYIPAIPEITHKPFIFGCFALSIDGKLYYPDTKSGFSIASCNSHATEKEQQADLLTLMIARTISDAIIVGTNSLSNEFGNFLPDINNSNLRNIRSKYNKPLSPTTFIICQDLRNLNFSDKLLSNNLHQVVICCINSSIDLIRLPPIYTQLSFANWKDKNDLTLKNIIMCDNLDKLISKIYKVGFNIILNESPYFHHQLLQLQLLDELWLNYSGSYIGGNLGSLGSTQQSFDSKNHPDCELLTLHILGYNFIYTRQKILYK